MSNETQPKATTTAAPQFVDPCERIRTHLRTYNMRDPFTSRSEEEGYEGYVTPNFRSSFDARGKDIIRALLVPTQPVVVTGETGSGTSTTIKQGAGYLMYCATGIVPVSLYISDRYPLTTYPHPSVTVPAAIKYLLAYYIHHFNPDQERGFNEQQEIKLLQQLIALSSSVHQFINRYTEHVPSEDLHRLGMAELLLYLGIPPTSWLPKDEKLSAIFQQMKSQNASSQQHTLSEVRYLARQLQGVPINNFQVFIDSNKPLSDETAEEIQKQVKEWSAVGIQTVAASSHPLLQDEFLSVEPQWTEELLSKMLQERMTLAGTHLTFPMLADEEFCSEFEKALFETCGMNPGRVLRLTHESLFEASVRSSISYENRDLYREGKITREDFARAKARFGLK